MKVYVISEDEDYGNYYIRLITLSKEKAENFMIARNAYYWKLEEFEIDKCEDTGEYV